MKNNFEQLSEELKSYYPGITDGELKEMTKRLIDFFVIGAKTVYEANNPPKDTDDNPNS